MYVRFPLLALVLLGCTSKPLPSPFDRTPLDAVFVLSDDDALRAIERIDSTANPASAVWWTVAMRDRSKDVALRARAAVALAEAGFREGVDFCLAVLGANLAAFADSDRRHGLPISDRWAFAREIALAYLRGRLLDAERPVPAYDVNFGAPQLAVAARAIAVAIDALPDLDPSIAADELTRLVPTEPAPGIDPQAWRVARADCVAYATNARPGSR